MVLLIPSTEKRQDCGIELLGQDYKDRAARIGLPGQGCQDRAVRTGCQDRTARINSIPGPDNKDSIARTARTECSKEDS